MILERPEEPGKKYALALAIAVHVLLLAFLFLGVQWKRSKPDVYEVELWAPAPRQATQVVAPPPPPPEPEVKPQPRPEPKPEPKVEPPLPKKPDIAIKEEKKKPEPKKPEPKPEPPKPEPKKPESKPEPKKPEPKFDFSKELANETSQLKSAKPSQNAQHLANAAAAEVEQRATNASAGLKSWGDKISRHIRQYVVRPNDIQGNPLAVFELRVLPSGDVLQPLRLKKSSGNSALDQAVERAIIKSSPLPKPDNGVFPNPLEIKYKPFEE